MAEPARRAVEEAPPLDPSAVERAYRLERAKRRARKERELDRRRARLRFLLAIVVLLAIAIAFGLSTWHEIQSLFGI